MTSGPHEDRLEVWRCLYLSCRLVVEGRVVDSAYDLACGLVAQLQEVRKVILAESSIVGEEPVFTLLPLSIGFLLEERGVGNGLHLLASFAPEVISLFFLCYCCHGEEL